MLDFKDNHGNYGHIFGNSFHDAVEDSKFKLNPNGTFSGVKGILGVLLRLCGFAFSIFWGIFKFCLSIAIWAIVGCISLSARFIGFILGTVFQSHEYAHTLKHTTLQVHDNPDDQGYSQQEFTNQNTMPNQSQQSQNDANDYRNETTQTTNTSENPNNSAVTENSNNFTKSDNNQNNGSNDNFGADLK